MERIFPLFSPKISKIEVNKRGSVRRARIFYLRNVSGKAARIEERKVATAEEISNREIAKTDKTKTSKPKKAAKAKEAEETVKS